MLGSSTPANCRDEHNDNLAIVLQWLFIGEGSFTHGNSRCPTRHAPQVNCTGKFDMNFIVLGEEMRNSFGLG